MTVTHGNLLELKVWFHLSFTHASVGQPTDMTRTPTSGHSFIRKLMYSYLKRPQSCKDIKRRGSSSSVSEFFLRNKARTQRDRDWRCKSTSAVINSGLKERDGSDVWSPIKRLITSLITDKSILNTKTRCAVFTLLQRLIVAHIARFKSDTWPFLVSIWCTIGATGSLLAGLSNWVLLFNDASYFSAPLHLYIALITLLHFRGKCFHFYRTTYLNKK